MDDFDPQAKRMLELSELIVNKISLNISNFNTDLLSQYTDWQLLFLHVNKSPVWFVSEPHTLQDIINFM